MYIKVKATPSAKKELFTKIDDTHFVVTVQEPSERNLANKRNTGLLAKHFGVSESEVHMLTGHRSRTKMYTVDIEN